MAIETIEIKIRRKGEDHDWGSKPPIHTAIIDIKDHARVKSVMETVVFANENLFDDAVEEVRWNVQGSQQGHYYQVPSKQFNPLPLVQAKADILAHKGNLDMSEYAYPKRGTPAQIKEVDCDTMFCIAGSIAIRHVGIVLGEYGTYVPANGEGFLENACDILGIRLAEGHCLFNTNSWKDINPSFYDIKVTAENAIKVIDEFLRLKGFDPKGQPLAKEEQNAV